MHYRRSRQSHFRFRIGAAAILLASFSPPTSASPRAWEPLVLKVSKTAGGAPIDHLETFAIHGGVLEPIPFQVDEASDDGSFLLPDGPEGKPVDTHRPLGPGDEVVMMFSDLGEKRSPKTVLPAPAVEVEVDDSADGSPRYAYMASEASPQLSTKHYVNFVPATETIETDHYRIGLRNGLPVDYATQSRMGGQGPNLIDRMKVRLSTRVFHMVPFSFNEDDIESRPLAWKVGPVRVIRRISHSVNLMMGLGTPEIERVDLFYRDSLDTPFKMPLPWAPKIFFGDIRVRIDLDFNGLDGYELLWSDMKIPPVKLGDPAMEHRIAEQGAIPVTWMGMRGPSRMTLQTLTPSRDLSLLTRQLYFNNDGARPDPPESTAGEHPGIGYVITGWENLGSGVKEFDALLITTPADYSPDVLMKELHAPPSVTVRPLPDTK